MALTQELTEVLVFGWTRGHGSVKYAMRTPSASCENIAHRQEENGWVAREEHQDGMSTSIARSLGMAKYVHEIVNPELFSFRPSESVSNALLGLLAMRITAVPVLSDLGEAVGMISLRDLLGEQSRGTVQERMHRPVHMIGKDEEIAEAGAQMAEHNVHHLVVHDERLRAVGVVSSLDIVRALLGIPVSYPETFAHVDPQGLTWTDPLVLDLEHAGHAPDGPGLLVLIRGEAGKSELPIWAESTNNVRTRIHELLSVPQFDSPYLARVLEHQRGHLRFRAAAVPDAAQRALGLQRAQSQVTRASGLPLPTDRSEQKN